MEKSYVAAFGALFQELKENPAIEVIAVSEEISEDRGYADYLLKNLRSKWGYNVPEEFKEYFSVSDDAHLRFVYYRQDKVAGGGEFHLNPLYDTMISLHDPGLWHDEMPPEKIEILKTFRVIDDHPQSGDFKLAAFSIREGVSPPRMPDIFFYDRGDYFAMDLDFGGYLDALLDLLGVSNWQYLFCDVDMASPRYSHLYDELKATLADLTAILPERDLQRYLKLLREKRS